MSDEQSRLPDLPDEARPQDEPNDVDGAAERASRSMRGGLPLSVLWWRESEPEPPT